MMRRHSVLVFLVGCLVTLGAVSPAHQPAPSETFGWYCQRMMNDETCVWYCCSDWECWESPC